LIKLEVCFQKSTHIPIFFFTPPTLIHFSSYQCPRFLLSLFSTPIHSLKRFPTRHMTTSCYLCVCYQQNNQKKIKYFNFLFFSVAIVSRAHLEVGDSNDASKIRVMNSRFFFYENIFFAMFWLILSEKSRCLLRRFDDTRHHRPSEVELQRFHSLSQLLSPYQTLTHLFVV
jgi:hypothetical protein